MTSSPRLCRDMILLSQAEIDGELDPAEAVAVSAHRADCPQCAAAYDLIRATRRALPESITYHRAPSDVRAGIERLLASEGAAARLPVRHLEVPPIQLRSLPVRALAWWRSSAIFGFGAGTGALAAAAVALVLLPLEAHDLGDAVVGGHIRALQPGHLIDLKSTKEHNVRPWFDGKLDFSPPVKDLADQGFPLDGCRLDYLDGHPAAALVYTAGHHAVDVFVWPNSAADSAPGRETRNGYNVYHWNRDKMAVWVVSDLDAAKLHDFVELWREAP